MSPVSPSETAPSADKPRAHHSPELCRFHLEAGHNQIIYREMLADTQTAVGAMLKLADQQTHACLLESVEGGEVRGRFSVIGLAPDLLWQCKDGVASINRTPEDDEEFEEDSRAPLESLRALMAEAEMPDTAPLPSMAAGLFGYFGYDMIREIENISDQNKRQIDVSDAMLMRVSLVAIFDRLKDTITLATQIRAAEHTDADMAFAEASARLDRLEAQLNAGLPVEPKRDVHEIPAEPAANMSKETFFNMVKKAKDYIKAGDIFQVVLSQRFSFPFRLPSMDLYRSLRRLNPSPFLFHFKLGDLAIVGSSPEILVRLRDGDVTIRPIAGTRKRGANAEEDQAQADDLLSDIKERAEHLMLLDLGRNDVGRVAKAGSVHLTSQFVVEYYSHVMHIASEVVGKIRPQLDAIDALIAGFPAGTVSGAPKIRAMNIIDELEPDKRGIYAGAIGYISAAGELDSCIALRTAILHQGQMHVQAGAGIVYDSKEQAEFEECQNKARALIRAASEAMRLAKQSADKAD